MYNRANKSHDLPFIEICHECFHIKGCLLLENDSIHWIINKVTRFHRSSCRQSNDSPTIFSLLCGGLQCSALIFNFLVFEFCRPDLLVPTCFIADTFWHFNILPPKNNNFSILYDTYVIFHTNCSIKTCSIQDWHVPVLLKSMLA